MLSHDLTMQGFSWRLGRMGTQQQMLGCSSKTSINMKGGELVK